MPMPRGGQGYGRAGLDMIKNSWGEGDLKDVLEGVDQMVKDGVADPDRLGAMGASYGGYLTDWMITQTHRFKAASAMCSISDIAGLYYLSDAGDVPSRRTHGALTMSARPAHPVKSSPPHAQGLLRARRSGPLPH